MLHLHKSLYGLRQAPRTFFEKLKEGLQERRWIQSEIDPCLFLKLGMICVVYVDDTIFGSLKITDLDAEISSLGISTHLHCAMKEKSVRFWGFRFRKLGSRNSSSLKLDLSTKFLKSPR